MSPTPEQITAMDARGWTWEAWSRSFRPIGMGDVPVVYLRVRENGDLGWIPSYGAGPIDYSPWEAHADPILAADEAETWLRSVLAPFRFPWLSVAATPKQEPVRAPRTCWTCRHFPSGVCEQPATDPAYQETERWYQSDNTDRDGSPVPTATPCPGFEAKP